MPFQSLIVKADENDQTAAVGDWLGQEIKKKATMIRVSTKALLFLAAFYWGTGFADDRFDVPEKKSSSRDFNDGYNISKTTGFAGRTFYYVFKDNQRIWKSPPVGTYLSISGGPERVDLDGDGRLDIMWAGGEPHLYCDNFGVIVSFSGKTQNYLFHYDSTTTEELPYGLLEISTEPPENLWPKLTPILQERACTSDQKERIADVILSKRYVIIKSASSAYAGLKQLHKKALALHISKKTVKAAELLDEFFFQYDYRDVDTENRDPRYTEILNDYGFFLEQLKERPFSQEQAIEILSYVIGREPSRTVAYLNLADAQFDLVKKRTDASLKARAVESYRTYHDIMVKAGMKNKIPARVFERMK